MKKTHPTDSRGGEGSSGEGEEGSSVEGEEGKSEEIEMESPLVHVVAEDNETHEEDGATVEEKDDYFQDPTSICKIYTRALPFFSWHHMDFSVMGNTQTLSFFCIPSATHRPNTDPEIPRVCEGHALRWRVK